MGGRYVAWLTAGKLNLASAICYWFPTHPVLMSDSSPVMPSHHIRVFVSSAALPSLPSPFPSTSLASQEAQLGEILQASQLDPAALRAVTQKLDDVLTAKNRAIRDLQYEVHRVTKVRALPPNPRACGRDGYRPSRRASPSCLALITSQAHNDAVRVYEAKLVEFGVPPEELGYEPVLTRTTTGPAGLVSALG